MSFTGNARWNNGIAAILRSPLKSGRGAETGQPRRLQPREVLARMMRGARERSRGDEQEALRHRHRLKRLELVGRDEAHHGMMLARRLQVLADGEEVYVRRAQVVHELENFVPLL